jgi:hypothetical protein
VACCHHRGVRNREIDQDRAEQIEHSEEIEKLLNNSKNHFEHSDKSEKFNLLK